MELVVNALEQGLLFALVAMGVYITYKILDFPDLSVDGTFPLGAAISAALLVNGVNAWLSIIVATIGGAIATKTAVNIFKSFGFNFIHKATAITNLYITAPNMDKVVTFINDIFPNIDTPIITAANPITTIPVPIVTSENPWC